jgi:hypothetical protein
MLMIEANDEFIFIPYSSTQVLQVVDSSVLFSMSLNDWKSDPQSY